MGDATDRGVALMRAAAVFGLDEPSQRVLEFLLERTMTAAAAPVRVHDLAGLLGQPALALEVLDRDAPLVRWRLVEIGDGPWFDRTVSLADSFWPRLVGHWPRTLPRALRLPASALDELALPDPVVDEARAAIRWMTARRRWPTLWVDGPVGSGRGTLARAIAAGLALPFLDIGGAQLAAIGVDAVAREAIWQQAAVVIDRGEDAEPAVIAALAARLLSPLLVTSSGPIMGEHPRERPSRRLAVPRLEHAHRAALWRGMLARASVECDAIAADTLAARFRLGPGQIEDAIEHARDGHDALSTEGLIESCRAIPSIEVHGLARRVETRATWDDLVVPAKLRRELELIVTCARHGAELFGAGERGRRLHAGRGVASLFWGLPGTGKTLAAQIVARALERDLYRVDLSQVVDKYLGETEKRLDRLFREAESADAVLLFDEADTVFTRRTEVHDARDRYANLETGFMLQRLEEHRGVCILASNARTSLDSAFQRRLLFVVEFPVPAAAERRGIWRALLTPDAPHDVDLDFLVERFAMSGGDIRNAVITASLLARRDGTPLGMNHLVIAGWREQTKVGRLVDLRELEPWADSVRTFVGATA